MTAFEDPGTSLGPHFSFFSPRPHGDEKYNLKMRRLCVPAGAPGRRRGMDPLTQQPGCRDRRPQSCRSGCWVMSDPRGPQTECFLQFL